jgi:hypothetical protein
MIWKVVRRIISCEWIEFCYWTGVVLSSIKATFRAVVDICWAMVVFFALSVLMSNYNVDISRITGLLNMISFIMDNWIYFFWLLAIWEFIFYFKEWMSDEK